MLIGIRFLSCLVFVDLEALNFTAGRGGARAVLGVENFLLNIFEISQFLQQLAFLVGFVLLVDLKLLVRRAVLQFIRANSLNLPHG